MPIEVGVGNVEWDPGGGADEVVDYAVEGHGGAGAQTRQNKTKNRRAGRILEKPRGADNALLSRLRCIAMWSTSYRISSTAMVLPLTISEASPLDPLLLLPLPERLPPSPLPSLDPLLLALEPHLSPSDTPKLPMTVLTAHMRQITRRSQVLLNAARIGAAEAREGLDGIHVDLRGVEYERDRVREEIERCEDYEWVAVKTGAMADGTG